MPTLLTLPAKLIHRILACLSQPHLSQVCLSCKTLQPLAEWRVYESVEFLFDLDVPLHTADPEDHVGLPIQKFFRTIWHRPELAAHVKSARFVTQNAFRCRVSSTPPPTDIRQAMVDAWAQTGLPPQGVDNAIAKDDLSAVTAVVLSRLRRLARLEVGYILLQHSPHVARILLHMSSGGGSPTENAAAADAAYRGLTRLSVRNDLDGKIIRVSNSALGLYDRDLPRLADTMLSFFFALDNLQELDLVFDSEPDLDLGPWQRDGQNNTSSNRVSLPRLRRLGILSCGANPTALHHMLAAAPRLETLEFFLVQDLEGLKADEGYVREHRDEWRAFAAALDPVRTTLKHLTVSVDWGFVDDIPPESMDAGWVDGVWQRRGDVGSLRHLACLKRLEVPVFVLLGWRWSGGRTQGTGRGLAEVLPVGLRELCLRDDLVDYGGYNWTPWNQDVVGGKVAESYRETCDPTAVLEELREYIVLPPSFLADSTERERPVALQALCFKMQAQFVWPLEYLMDLEAICRYPGVLCTVRVRMSGFRTGWDDWSDEVKKIIIYDPRGGSSEGRSSTMDSSETQNSEESSSDENSMREASSSTSSSPSPSDSSSHSSGLWEDMYEWRYLNEPSRVFRNRYM